MIRVIDAEMPRQVGTLRLLRNPCAHRVHVTLHIRVVEQRTGTQQCLYNPVADLDFFRLCGFPQIGERFLETAGFMDIAHECASLLL